MSNQILIRVTWWYSLEASSEASSNPVRRALEFVDKEQVFMQFVWEISLTVTSQNGICRACKILLSNFINKYLKFRLLITFRWAVFIWWDYSHYWRHRFDLMNTIVCSAAEFKCGQPLFKAIIIQCWNNFSAKTFFYDKASTDRLQPPVYQSGSRSILQVLQHQPLKVQTRGRSLIMMR